MFCCSPRAIGFRRTPVSITGALEVNMSALTGNRVPVQRAAGTPDTADRLIDAPDAIFSGTVCTSGEARAAVFATGNRPDLAYLGRMDRTDRRRSRTSSAIRCHARRSGRSAEGSWW